MYELHIIFTWIHLLSAVYWLGAISFILSTLGPVLRQQPSIVVPPIMAGVHQRVRRFVLFAIIAFVATGMFNMYYRGLFNLDTLLKTPYGITFLVKMVPVSIMFILYVMAPSLMKKYSSREDDENCTGEGACCEMEDGPKPGNKVFAVLHVIALVCGLVAVYLGTRLRG